jgi:hypothetical protein
MGSDSVCYRSRPELAAITGAVVYFTVRYPSGREAVFYIPERTDQNGVTRMTFRTEEGTMGITEIKVTVTYEKFKRTTVTLLPVMVVRPSPC